MAKLQITTEEAYSILRALSLNQITGKHPMNQELYGRLSCYIQEENDRVITCIHGLPTKAQLTEEGIEFLDRYRNPYIGYYNAGEDKPYSIFESLGEDAGSDDDPIWEFATYEEMEKQWEAINE